MHETLIAQSSFPIYKTEQELKAEKDSIWLNMTPYFRISTAKTTKLKVEILAYARESIDRTIDSYSKGLPETEFESNLLDTIILEVISEIVDALYIKGVLPENEEILRNKPSDSYLMIVKNDIAELLRLSEFPAVNQTENKIIAKLESIVFPQNTPFDFVDRFKKQFKLQPYLKSNLEYDQVLTRTKQQMLLDNLSLSHGMIRENERIISEGEIISEEKFKILESYKREYEAKIGVNSNFGLLITGQFLVVLSVIIIFFLFLYNYRREVLNDFKQSLFILLMIVLFVSIAGLVIRFKNINLYFIPFALLPIIVRTFYDSRLAIFILLITILLIGFIVPNGFQFVFIQFVAGVVAIFTMHNARKRSQLFWSAFFVFLTYSFLSIALNLLQEGSIATIHWPFYIWLLGNSVLLLSSYPLIYLFEKLFGFLSDLSLLELSDTNNPLLRELASKAPGTFQHSMQVANLAEEAIYHIGGNPLLMRTGALYHDIGKMENAAFFIENLQNGFNPHNELGFEESADIIIGHVNKGVQLAKKFKLPQQIIDFIETHHGTTRVQYFYKSFLKKYPNEEADISRFTYPGPLPYSKETVVLMMADSVEAASRSMKEYSDKNINDLVDQIINYQEQEGQFDDANITFKDVSQVKEIFKEKLKNIYHQRIEYPR